MIYKLRNTSVRELIRALEKDNSSIQGVKAVIEFIGILMVDVLLYIIIMRKKPCRLAYSKVFSMAHNGMKMTSKDPD